MKHQCFAVKPDLREKRIAIFRKGPGAGTIGWVLEIRWATDKIIVDIFVYDDQGLEAFGIPKIVSVSIRKGLLAPAEKSETGLVSTEGYLRLLLYLVCAEVGKTCRHLYMKQAQRRALNLAQPSQSNAL
ncbi:hypothetical protein HYALB_00009085 [Hymenoscyphus albidus]|uniref:Uncharacterized protein n=1 Tax=Hymenoscyphus albidus TaxID=595503 RepID=A0A9N9LSM8_9HELO|nr:hypothetical protein HYALB_00009085 [Hymenoscyphus albidus]